MIRPATPCPDWVTLVAARDGEPLPSAAVVERGTEGDLEGDIEGDTGEPLWHDALAHLADCSACRPRALAADPTLLFQALPRIEASADEVAAMRQAVTAMRRAGRVAAPSPRRRWVRVASRLSLAGRRGRGLAAAALLAAVSGGLWLGIPGPGSEPTVSRAERPVAGETVRTIPFGETTAPAGGVLPASGEPVFMDLSSPRAADVYRVGRGGGLQVVMVVDETLDV